MALISTRVHITRFSSINIALSFIQDNYNVPKSSKMKLTQLFLVQPPNYIEIFCMISGDVAR
jgi:hypothetical protein